MTALCLAVRTHVAEAFRKEGMILGGIWSGTITTTEQIDKAYVPDTNGAPA
jgi:hypothetical protein